MLTKQQKSLQSICFSDEIEDRSRLTDITIPGEECNNSSKTFRDPHRQDKSLMFENVYQVAKLVLKTERC